MSYLNVLNRLKNNETAPVYLLYGIEAYFIQNLVEIIRKNVLGSSEHSNENLSTYDLEETPIEEVIEDVETYPFFGEKKLIIAHNPVFLQARPPTLPFDHNLEKLQQYIHHPVEYSVLVFIAPYEKMDNRKTITKALNKDALVASCNPIKEYELAKWITHLAKDFNVRIDRDAYPIFETEVDINLYLLQNEIEKMALYVGENGVITREIAQDLISQTTSGSALRLVDAVIEQDLHEAVSIFTDLRKMNEEPIALIALLAFQFRMILRVKLLKEKGYSQYQMQKQIGGHPYVIKIAYERERRFSTKQLMKIINRLTEADTAVKSGKMEKELVFELLLYELVESVAV